MTSRQSSTVVSVLVFALVLATPGSAEAQWASYPQVSPYGLGYGAGPGTALYGYGSFGAGGYAGSGNFVGFPFPGYAQSIGLRPLTTTLFQSVSDTVTLVPGWDGYGHQVYHRNRAPAGVRAAAIRR